MIVDTRISFRRLIPIIWRRIAAMALLSAAIVVPIELFDLQFFSLGMTTPLILGTAISIFLGFRTNSAYERWMTARRSFGQMTAQTRNLALVLARIGGEPYRRVGGEVGGERMSEAAPAVMRRMIRRGVAVLYVFARDLRGEGPPLEFETAGELLSRDERECAGAHPFPASYLLFLQARDFREVMRERQLTDGEHFEFVAIQRELSSLMTACRGIATTPFPPHYTFFPDVFIWLLVVLLSLSLPSEEVNGFYAIPAVVLIGWIFTMIEGIGSYMDHPWAFNRNTVPATALARDLERELRATALEDTTLPPAKVAVEGAVY